MQCALYIEHPAKARLRGSRSDKTESGLLSGLSREASTKRRSGIRKNTISILCIGIQMTRLRTNRYRNPPSQIDHPAKARLRGSLRDKTESGLLSGLSREASTKRRSGIRKNTISILCIGIHMTRLRTNRYRNPPSQIDHPAKARLRGSRRDKTESGLLSGLSREASTKRRSGISRISESTPYTGFFYPLRNYRYQNTHSNIYHPAKARLRGSRSDKTESALLSGLSRKASTKRRSGSRRNSNSIHYKAPMSYSFVQLI